ncbi:hypothetical protein ACHAXR_005464 [Thalassiosira sp. AJA248-18]
MTTKKFRMVALDLDGTLLNSNHDISDATIAHLRRLHDKGFIIAIATGRSAACTAHIIEKLDIAPIPSSTTVADNNSESAGFPLVCTNGARGLRIRKSDPDVAGHSHATNINDDGCAPPTNPFLKQTLIIDEDLFHNPLSPSLTLKTLALAHRLGCVTNYYHNHHIFAVARNEEQLQKAKRYGKLTGSTDLYIYLNEENESQLYNEDNAYGYQRAMELGPPSKLLILCGNERLDEITDKVRAELNGSSSATDQRANVIRGTPPFFVEILDPAVHKGHGLRQLCQSLSIPLDEVIAFGDGDNDMEFIQMAGLGVAMKNARDVVKEKADEVADWSNDEDGVTKTLEQFEQEGRLFFPSIV